MPVVVVMNKKMMKKIMIHTISIDYFYFVHNYGYTIIIRKRGKYKIYS